MVIDLATIKRGLDKFWSLLYFDWLQLGYPKDTLPFVLLLVSVDEFFGEAKECNGVAGGALGDLFVCDGRFVSFLSSLVDAFHNLVEDKR